MYAQRRGMIEENIFFQCYKAIRESFIPQNSYNMNKTWKKKIKPPLQLSTHTHTPWEGPHIQYLRLIFCLHDRTKILHFHKLTQLQFKTIYCSLPQPLQRSSSRMLQSQTIYPCMVTPDALQNLHRPQTVPGHPADPDSTCHQPESPRSLSLGLHSGLSSPSLYTDRGLPHSECKIQHLLLLNFKQLVTVQTSSLS